MGLEYKLVILGVLTLGLAWISRASLFKPRAHGFYRFWAWEVELVMVLLNLEVWFAHPFAWYQLVSWGLLILSAVLAIHGALLLRSLGKPVEQRGDSALIGFEKTTTLVKRGAYRLIRHPMYASLFYLAWGVFFKSPGWLGGLLGALATGLLVVTARIEEGENLRYFGEVYRDYMKETKRFIPFVF
jgi:protein-S-isoprenylcysteine O-methyltransferase Ste14